MAFFSTLGETPSGLRSGSRERGGAGCAYKTSLPSLRRSQLAGRLELHVLRTGSRLWHPDPCAAEAPAWAPSGRGGGTREGGASLTDVDLSLRYPVASGDFPNLLWLKEQSSGKRRFFTDSETQSKQKHYRGWGWTGRSDSPGASLRLAALLRSNM